jgi:hypothetical protein
VRQHSPGCGTAVRVESVRIRLGNMCGGACGSVRATLAAIHGYATDRGISSNKFDTTASFVILPTYDLIMAVFTTVWISLMIWQYIVIEPFTFEPRTSSAHRDIQYDSNNIIKTHCYSTALSNLSYLHSLSHYAVDYV